MYRCKNTDCRRAKTINCGEDTHDLRIKIKEMEDRHSEEKEGLIVDYLESVISEVTTNGKMHIVVESRHRNDLLLYSNIIGNYMRDIDDRDAIIIELKEVIVNDLHLYNGVIGNYMRDIDDRDAIIIELKEEIVNNRQYATQRETKLNDEIINLQKEKRDRDEKNRSVLDKIKGFFIK